MRHNIVRDIALATKLVILWTGISVYTSIPVNKVAIGFTTFLCEVTKGLLLGIVSNNLLGHAISFKQH